MKKAIGGTATPLENPTMEQQKPSNRPTVELNHEHITTLRSVNEVVAIDRELATIHDQYLAGEYQTTEFGHAFVDDLDLNPSQIAHLDRQLRKNMADLPIDVVEHLAGEFDHYDQIKFCQPVSSSASDDYDDDSGGDIMVADGGVEITPSSVEPPSRVADIIQLCEGDRVVFQVDSQTFTGTIDLTRWETTDGVPDDPGFEVTSAYVELDSDATQFDGQTTILHAARPLNGEWRDDEPVVIDTDDMTEDVGPIEELHSISQAETPSWSVSPDSVADLYHYEPEILNDFASQAAQRVAEQWSEHRREAVIELISAGFHPKNIDVTSERVEGIWKLTIRHDGALDDHTTDGHDPEAAKRDFCEDVIAEICELVRRQVKDARAGSLRVGVDDE
ncbi:hypothetical protein [Natrinema sp. DC36]|uniref:hypothetical protein n=1 Tax=Natrinema sp. DC36 TaxID=2878680 RepID=UPI001CF05352|nr:hypothetical protein [Natrinema sp. DC36]